jgi:hypothetical protein
MAKTFDMKDRCVSPAWGREPEQRSKATGGGPSPLDPMGAAIPGYCAPAAQSPGDCPERDCDYAPLSRKGEKTGKKLPGQKLL